MSIAEVQKPEWLQRKERGSAAVMRLTVWLALKLGWPVARLILPPICLYFVLFSGGARRASFAYLNRALDRRATLLDVFRHFHTFSACVLHRAYFLKDRTEAFDIRIHGEEVVLDILASGTGCLLLGGHLGSFEALRTVGRNQPNLSVKMVMYDENARKVTSVLRAINPELAKDVINLGRPDAFMEVMQCLDEGAFVGILADRSLSNERRIACSLLGTDAFFSVSTFRIIALMKKPVVFMVGLYRGNGRYDIHFERFAAAEEFASRPNAERLAELIQRYADRLEHHCKDAPYNWFNFFDFWS